MQRVSDGLWLVGLAIGLLCLGGCGSVNSLGTEYVEGVVTLDGTPVADATVMFVPVNPGEGASATGITDASGVYKLTAANTGDAKGVPGAGTLPGEYYVGVMKTSSPTVMSEEEAFDKGIAYKPPAPGQEPKVEHLVPQKYNDPQKSGLQKTVTPGNNKIDIELTK